MKGETLSELELGRLKPVSGEGGRSWRAFCPFHGSDQQRSLRVDRQTGRFQCFACEAWGYMDWARERFAEEMKRAQASPPRAIFRPLAAPLRPPSPTPARNPAPSFHLPLAEILAAYQQALPGSLGEEYLTERGIPLALAQRFGLGYSAPGQWAHRSSSGKVLRDGPFGRLVFPHTDPDGQLCNLYGRAVGERVPKPLRHDHLPGSKGYFNAPVLQARAGKEIFVCEGPFDALSLLAVDSELPVVAIFGVQGWRPDWAAACRSFALALDDDRAGQSAWRSLARQLTLRGKRVRVLLPSHFGGAKDLNEALQNGTLSRSALSDPKAP